MRRALTSKPLFLLLLCVSSLAPLSQVHAGDCATSVTQNGGLFVASEEVSYSPEGYVQVDLKLSGYGGTLPMVFFWTPYNDECDASVPNDSSTTFDLPPGISDLSIRFLSSTSFELRDVTHDVALTSGSIPALPTYSRIQFALMMRFDSNTRIITSKIPLTEGASAPILSETLPTSLGCSPLASGGFNQYYFDGSYERAEYVDGFLRVHLRLKSPHNDGRPFRSAAVTTGENCNFPELPHYSSLPHTTFFTPYVRYYSFRMTSPTQWQVWDDESDIPLTCGSCSGTISTDAPFVSWYANIDAGADFIRTAPFSPIDNRPRFPGEYDPVVIIPGILGSWEKKGEWVIDPVLHVYDDLLDTFEANGYVRGETLFPFAYNWRNSNIDTAQLLKEEIERIREICGCNKVDVIAHSMGGLVARAYSQGDEYQNDIDQLVFLGTPHLGAPEIYLMWEGGEIEERGNLDFIKRLIFLREARRNGYSNVFEYVRNRPISSVEQLLPTFNYLSENSLLRVYPLDYPLNQFIQGLTASTEKLSGRGIRFKNVIGKVDKGSIDLFDVVDSNEFPKWEHGKPEATLFTSGDGKVPLRSSSIPGLIEIHQEFDAEHSELPSVTSAYSFAYLNNRDAQDVVTNWRAPNIPLIIIQLFSPIDMVITAPDGKRLGKNFESGGEVAEIPGAFYSGFIGDDEYAVIPNPLPGEYVIETLGTGYGEYTIAASYITDTGATTTEISGDAQIGKIEQAKLVLDPNASHVELTAGITPESAIEDIHRAYVRGWILKAAVRDSLIREFEELRKLIIRRDQLLTSQIDGKKKRALLFANTLLIRKVLEIDIPNILKKNKKYITAEAVTVVQKNVEWFKKDLLQ